MTQKELAEKRKRIRNKIANILSYTEPLDRFHEADKVLNILASEGVKIVDEKAEWLPLNYYHQEHNDVVRGIQGELKRKGFQKIYPLTGE